MCDKQLSPVAEDTPYQPNDGVYLRTHGNYGSTVFDSIFKEEFLEMYICDPCLLAKVDSIFHFSQHKPKPVDDIVPWRQYREDKDRADREYMRMLDEWREGTKNLETCKTCGAPWKHDCPDT